MSDSQSINFRFKIPKYPYLTTEVKGHLEISKNRDGIYIGGDPEGLRSLAKILLCLADADQESHPNMPDGEREHVHLCPGGKVSSLAHLTRFSTPTELCRLDAKGTGELPDKYLKKSQTQSRRKKGPRGPVRRSRQK